MTARPEPDPLLSATPADVERGIARELLKHPVAHGAARIAEIVMVVVGPVLEAKDAEIKRARGDGKHKQAIPQAI